MSLTSSAIQSLVAGEHGDPFAVLGPHPTQDGSLSVRALLPGATEVTVLVEGGAIPAQPLKPIHADGLWEGMIPGRLPIRYRLRVTYADGHTLELEDPYRFPSTLSGFDLHLLGEGRHYRIYEKLGAHAATLDGVAGVIFAVWAPNAQRVSVVGDWNAWDGRRHPMRLHPGNGIWELFLPGVTDGARYKFEIRARSGAPLALKTDPYAFGFEPDEPRTASVVARLDGYQWSDDAWLAERGRRQALDAPVSVYEVHLGSWRHVPEEGHRSLDYREAAERLADYVSEMGFTHVELLPVMEHPFYGSWGYQTLGYYAPTRRFGRPHDFMAFVDHLHQRGIGVILDWVPAHFPRDPHGLAYFDGTHLFEHADPREREHPDWGTRVFNYGRREVANFLIGNALFWLERYHVDGLRVDAVASMIYRDYSRKAGEWVPNVYGGRENLEAIAFLKRLNEVVYGTHPGAVTIAEESTAWPMVSRPVHLGGLGFGYKWNMGWMHDMLDYLRHEPVHRKYHHNQLTFGMLYAWSENFVLPLSHDEVVHGKGPLVGKMPGDEWQRFAALRLLFGFMWAYPGKKLLFMGGEFGQTREWNHDRSLDWHLLGENRHAGIHSLIRDLNRLYRSVPALYEMDCNQAGFEWVITHDSGNNIFAWLRKGFDAHARCLVIVNFSPSVHQNYRVRVPFAGKWREALNSDSAHYGGSNVG